MPDRSGEFSLIAHYLRPLATHAGGLQLLDDAAILNIASGMEMVVTKDLLVENTHFFPHDRPADIAKKLLRVNLSDLAAMGAAPLGYFLGLCLPKDVSSNWIKAFATGLAEDNAIYRLSLLGGDTVAHNGPIVLSLTAYGQVAAGQHVPRSGAKPGDAIYVTGTLGDSALGLKILTGLLALPADAATYLTQRYYLPEPKVALGQRLAGVVNSMIDVSDGFCQDLQHILTTSNVGAEIDYAALPISQAAAMVSDKMLLAKAILAGGDDYELLFTVPEERIGMLENIARETETNITKIGKVVAAPGFIFADFPFAFDPTSLKGFDHFD
jgi:thiamine-monophosphate kinase